MPAVSEKPEVKKPEVALPAGDPIEQYKMPKPALGSSVLFYKYARKDQPIDPEVVFVQKIGARSIIVRSTSGNFFDTVRHVSDPKLALGDEQRAFGAWDFTEEYHLIRSLQAEIVSLKELITK